MSGRYQRKMWLTYGFKVNKTWDPAIDDDTNKYRDMNSPTGYIKKDTFDPVIFKS